MLAVFIMLKAVDKIKGYYGIFTAALSALGALIISNLVYGSLRPGGMLIYDYILMGLEGVFRLCDGLCIPACHGGCPGEKLGEEFYLTRK